VGRPASRAWLDEQLAIRARRAYFAVAQRHVAARELALRTTSDGLRLVQQPVRELRKLRRQHQLLGASTLREANDWLQRQGIAGDQLEMEVEFETAAASEFGLKILPGPNEVTVIGFNASHNRLFLDRSHSGKTDFHPKFTGVYEAPLRARDGKLRLHVFLDTSSVEVFGNDGEATLTALVFPGENTRRLEFWSTPSMPRIRRLDIWKLNSAWR